MCVPLYLTKTKTFRFSLYTNVLEGQEFKPEDSGAKLYPEAPQKATVRPQEQKIEP